MFFPGFRTSRSQDFRTSFRQPNRRAEPRRLPGRADQGLHGPLVGSRGPQGQAGDDEEYISRSLPELSRVFRPAAERTGCTGIFLGDQVTLLLVASERSVRSDARSP